MDNKLKCKICGQEFTNYCSVTTHTKRKHNIDSKTYYDTHFKLDSEGFCKNCGKPVEYRDLQHGYREFCSRKCFWQYTTKLQSTKDKRKATCLDKFGTESYMASADFKQKAEQTNLSTCGCKNAGGSAESIAKIKATKLANHGSENYNNIEQMRATKLVKYNNEWYSNREQALQTLATKYNVNEITTPYSIKEIHEKSLNTIATKYDYPYTITSPFCIPEISKKALGHTSNMTKPEKKLNEFLTNRKFNFQYGYECNGKNFDFAIFNNENKLQILIEIDGLYYHGLTEDSNGKHVRGDTDHERFSKVPEGVKFIVCDENKLENCFTEILKVYDVDYNEWLNAILQNMPTEFPYPVYDDKRLLTDWNHLQQWDWNPHSRVGISIVNNYHKHIWQSKVGNNLSPVECWQNKELLMQAIKNRVIYSSTLSSQAIAAGFNICKIAPKVSVFNPMLAKHIVKSYLSDYETVFDPFSGFSGRMLGACACGKKYIGQDINEIHVKESNEIIDKLKLNAVILQKDIFESTGEYDCLFTCSPYCLKEIWNEHETNKSCDEWIDECLQRFKCKCYVFVVDKTEKYKDKIVEEISNKSHFSNAKEYIIVI